MARVRCTVTLLADKNRKVDIEICKENNGNRLWNLIKAAGGNLSLPTTTGAWKVIPGDTLALWEHNSKRKVQDQVMLVVFDINKDFMDDIVRNGKQSLATMPAYITATRPKKTFRADWRGCIEFVLTQSKIKIIKVRKRAINQKPDHTGLK